MKVGLNYSADNLWKLSLFFKLQILKKKEPKSVTYYAYTCTIFSGTHAMIFAEYSLSVRID